MTPRHRQLLMVIVPCTGLLLWRVVAPRSHSEPAAATAQSAVSNSPAVVARSTTRAAADEGLWAVQRRRAALVWGRDPFASVVGKPLATSGPAPVSGGPIAPDWTLSGVAVSGGQRIAILGGRVVRRGQRIADRYKVVEIGPNDVRLREGQWEHRFVLGTTVAETTRVGGER